MDLTDTDALLVVDVQNDFCPGGALPVDNGDAVVPTINRLLLKFSNVVFSRDWHPHDHCSFSETPEFRDKSWPMHCVQESPGAMFHGDLHVPSDAAIIDKGTDRDQEAYSQFADPALEQILREKGVRRVFVCGLATDYCVRATALDASARGFDTVLIRDACRGVAPETTAAALEEMEKAGVSFVSSRDLT